MSTAPPGAPPPRRPGIAHKEGIDPHVVGMVELALVGVVLGASVFFAVFRSTLVAILGAVAGGLLLPRVPGLVAHLPGSVFFASGRTTPTPAGHSLAHTLAVQGHFEAARSEFERGIQENPDDPQAYVELARLCRDRLDRPADALAWLRRARGARRLTPARDALIVRELAALCADRLHEPLRAAPELSQLAAARAGTPDGDWARRELERIRAEARALRGGSTQAPPPQD